LSISGLLEGAAARDPTADRLDDLDNGTSSTTSASSHDEWEQWFWNAFKSLSGDEWDLVELGISNAIQLQQAIVRQGAWLIEHRVIVHTGPFRYAFLAQTTDAHWFAHPLALVKLALFLLDTLHAKSAKPIVLCALNEATKTFLISGTAKSNNKYAHLLNHSNSID